MTNNFHLSSKKILTAVPTNKRVMYELRKRKHSTISLFYVKTINYRQITVDDKNFRA